MYIHYCYSENTRVYSKVGTLLKEIFCRVFTLEIGQDQESDVFLPSNSTKAVVLDDYDGDDRVDVEIVLISHRGDIRSFFWFSRYF